MKTLLALLILIPSFSMSLTFKDGKQVKEKKYGEVVYCINNSSKKVLKSRSGLCPNKYKISSKKAYLHYLSTKNEITIDINTENYKPVVWCKNPTNGYIRKMSSCPIGDFTEQSSRDEYLLSLKQKKIKVLEKKPIEENKTKLVKSNTSNQTNTTKSLSNNTSTALNIIDKNELKEQLKYWKSLLDDELISQKDYDNKKDELLNSLGSEKKVLKTTNSNNTSTSNSNTASNNNLASDIDNLIGTSDTNSNTSSNTMNSSNPCSSMNVDFNKCNKKYDEVRNWSNSKLCMKLKDVFFISYEELYLETASLRNITCSDGVAYKSGTAPNIVNSYKPEDYETSCNIIGSGSYSNVKCKTKKKSETTRELVGDLIGEILNQID